jgi:hypothetical protein
MLKKKYYDGTQVHRIISEEVKDYDTIMKILKRFADEPSAQPMRKKGKWTTEDCHAATYKYCCSNCKAHHRARYDFCPSCGADMRGDHNG